MDEEAREARMQKKPAQVGQLVQGEVHGEPWMKIIDLIRAKSAMQIKKLSKVRACSDLSSFTKAVLEVSAILSGEKQSIVCRDAFYKSHQAYKLIIVDICLLVSS